MSVEEIPGGYRYSIELTREEFAGSHGLFDTFDIEPCDDPRRFQLTRDVPIADNVDFLYDAGAKIAGAMSKSMPDAWFLIELLNRLNEGYKEYDPYEIPADRNTPFVGHHIRQAADGTPIVDKKDVPMVLSTLARLKGTRGRRFVVLPLWMYNVKERIARAVKSWLN